MSLIVYNDIFSGKGKEITKPIKTSQPLVYSAEPSFNINSSHQVLNCRTDSLTIAENLSQLCFLINKKHLWYNRGFKQIKFKWRQIMKFCLFYVLDVWQNLKFAKTINDIYMGLWILKNTIFRFHSKLCLCFHGTHALNGDHFINVLDEQF